VKLLQRKWTAPNGWETIRDELDNQHRAVQLIFLFWDRLLLDNNSIYKELYAEFPKAIITGCSTAGEICGSELVDQSLILTAVYFEYSTVKASHIFLDQYPHTKLSEVAEELAKSLLADDLVHVFILADGIMINGSKLVEGFREVLPAGISVSGGLAADGYRFEEATVVADVRACKNTVSVIGLYGQYLKVKISVGAGWNEFGAERMITKSAGNVLYELDRQPALPLYEQYLGDSFKNVPASSIQYPISLKCDKDKDWMTRTIMKVNRDTKSLSFAGDVPMGYTARLMKTDTGLLIDSAMAAARDITKNSFFPDLAILVSCFGRRGVMQDDTGKELLAVQKGLGDKTFITGFYSYGEIAPFNQTTRFELHNQTMTITALTEKP
jgi:hypothetical protein